MDIYLYYRLFDGGYMNHVDHHNEVGVGSYVVGFVASLILTLAAYYLVINQIGSGLALGIALMTLAVTQFTVQLVFFLHLGRESKPYWDLAVFIFMCGVLLTVVIGSLWIIHNLNHGHGYSHGTPAQTDQFIIHDEGIKH
jgi:cytochrome o ubiquinol oxidase operon protein cyoD